MTARYWLALLPRSVARRVRVERRGCWLWTGARNGAWYTRGWGGGYGYLWTGARAVRAHRYIWELLRGDIPAGLVLMHQITCPRHCVNPWHLTPGTKSENAQGVTR